MCAQFVSFNSYRNSGAETKLPLFPLFINRGKNSGLHFFFFYERGNRNKDSKVDPESQKPCEHIDLPGRADENKRESRGEVRTQFQIISKGRLTVWLSVPRRRQDSLGPFENKNDVPLLFERRGSSFLFFSAVLNEMGFNCERLIPKCHDWTFSRVSLRVAVISPHHTLANDLSKKKKT